VRKLARFAASPLGPPRLAWSPDGTWVAWLIGDQRIGLAKAAGGPVRTWRCSCGAIGFDGNALVSDSFTGKPHLLRYPANGSAPVRIPITGLAKSHFSLNVFDLLTATPTGHLIAGYGTGVSAYGGPQLLYRISPKGRATLFAPKARQRTANTVPWGFAFSPSGSRMSFMLTGHGGFCANSDRVVLAKPATGEEAVPKMPAGRWNAARAWFGPSGTPYVSLARPPCPGGTAKAVLPRVYRDEQGRWVRVGKGTIDAGYFAGRRKAVLTGKVITTGDGITQTTRTRLTVSHGSARFTIANVTDFAWVP
jgi:hypothetical protein